MLVPYESYTETATHTQLFYGNRQGGQSFTPASSHIIASFAVYCKKLGSPGTATFKLYLADSGGLPTGSVLTTGTVAEADIPSASKDWMECTLIPYSLVAGIKYVVTWEVEGATSGNRITTDHVSAGATMYAGGARVYSSDAGVNWVAYDGTGGYSDDDSLFKDSGEVAVFPTDAITRVTNLVHHYNRKEGVFALVLSLGEVTSDFGLPQWLSKPMSAAPKEAKPPKEEAKGAKPPKERREIREVSIEEETERLRKTADDFQRKQEEEQRRQEYDLEQEKLKFERLRPKPRISPPAPTTPEIEEEKRAFRRKAKPTPPPQPKVRPVSIEEEKAKFRRLRGG